MAKRKDFDKQVIYSESPNHVLQVDLLYVYVL